MWSLKSVTDGRVICTRKTIEEIGAEKMWYENRGYKVLVEKERPIHNSQLPLMD